MEFFERTPHYDRACNNEACKGSSGEEELNDLLRGMRGIEYVLLATPHNGETTQRPHEERRFEEGSLKGEAASPPSGITVILERYREGPTATRSTSVFFIMEDGDGVTYRQDMKPMLPKFWPVVNCDTGGTLTVRARRRRRAWRRRAEPKLGFIT